jgi:hypothetical protein
MRVEFRRFRLTWLRKNGVPKDLERYWVGHASEEVGDLHSKLKDDVSFRQEWAERAGLGFELVHVGPQNADAVGYLLDLFGIGTDAERQSLPTVLTATYVPLDPSLPSEGLHAARWRLQLNIPADELLAVRST